MGSSNNGRWTRRPIKSRSKMISFRVTTDEMQSLMSEADRRQITVSVLVRQALERLLDQRSA
jgi:hypothetical protein